LWSKIYTEVNRILSWDDNRYLFYGLFLGRLSWTYHAHQQALCSRQFSCESVQKQQPLLYTYKDFPGEFTYFVKNHWSIDQWHLEIDELQWFLHPAFQHQSYRLVECKISKMRFAIGLSRLFNYQNESSTRFQKPLTEFSAKGVGLSGHITSVSQMIRTYFEILEVEKLVMKLIGLIFRQPHAIVSILSKFLLNYCYAISLEFRAHCEKSRDKKDIQGCP